MQRVILLLLILILHINIGCASGFIADLSTNQIEIDSSFNGSELLLFGTLHPEDELLIVVASEKKSIDIKRHFKKFGLWMGIEKQTIHNIPFFYHLLSTKPIHELENNLNLNLLELGSYALMHNIKYTDAIKYKNSRDFFEAFVHINQEKKLYFESYESINIKDKTLFKAKLIFPANVPLGKYIVQVFLYDNYQLLNVQNIPIIIVDKGFNQFIFNVAQKHKFLYLFFFVIITVTATIISSYLIRKF